jgi:hypothetical protein
MSEEVKTKEEVPPITPETIKWPERTDPVLPSEGPVPVWELADPLGAIPTVSETPTGDEKTTGDIDPSTGI